MSEENSHETIRVIKFKGEEEEWREWALKTKAMGLIKGWWSEMEAVEELDLKSTDEEMKERIKKNDAAFHYLVMACSGPAFLYLEGCGGSAKKAWNNLKQRYEANESTDLIELLEKFNKCKMKKHNENPDAWFQELEYLRKRIETAGGTYKDDMELISHVIMYAPKEYKVPIEVMSATRENLTLEQVKRTLSNYWKRTFKDEEVSRTAKNEALNVETQ